MYEARRLARTVQLYFLFRQPHPYTGARGKPASAWQAAILNSIYLDIPGVQ